MRTTHRLPARKVVLIFALAAALLLPGCLGLFEVEPFVDHDLDGIPDGLERDLATSCMIMDRTCAELGVEPPEVGARDYVLVQFGRSGPDQDWRLPEDVWADFHTMIAVHGSRVQIADLGVRDDIDIEATWADPDNDGGFWFTWLTYDAPDEDTAGWNVLNWINLHREEDTFELLQTLLHEVYHSVLGDLARNHSRCPDEEEGGRAHSNDPASILHVPRDCDTDGVDSLTLGRHELAQLAGKPFANLHAMNHEGWTQLEWEPRSRRQACARAHQARGAKAAGPRLSALASRQHRSPRKNVRCSVVTRFRGT